MLKNVGKDGFEILGQTGVPPVDIPRFGWNGPRLGWPELILPRRARGTARKKVSVLTGNRFGWNRHAEKRRERWV